MRYLIIALLFLVGACGEKHQKSVAQEVADNLECVWSEKHNICICVCERVYQGYMTIAPPITCNRILMPSEKVKGKVEEDIEL